MQSLDQPPYMRDLQKGENKAFETVMHTFYPSLVYFAARIIHDTDTAEDIVEESFVKLWHKHAHFPSIQSVRAFLYVCTRNACLNHLKQQQYRTRELERAKLHMEGETPAVLNEITRAEVMREVYQAIEELPPRCRTIIRLAFGEGLSNEKIAQRLNISPYTVKNQKARGIQLLRKKLNRDIFLLVLLLLSR